MKSFIVMLLVLFMAGVAGVVMAGGDKVRASSQILEPGDAPCVFMIPPGINVDIDTCSATTVDEDGNAILRCPFGDVLVICVAEDDNPGKSSK